MAVTVSAEQVASAVVPLLVGLFNLLIAGYTFAAGARDRSRYAFALGPAGVGAWALAWFVVVFQPESRTDLKVIGAAGGAIAMLGYAADALRGWPWRRLRIVLGAGVFGVLMLEALVVAVFGDRYEVDPIGVGLRAIALVAGATTFGARAIEWRRGVEARFARWTVVSALVVGVGCSALAILAFLGERAFVDVLLFVILWAELLALGYVIHRRVEVRVLVSRAASYAILSIVVAIAASLVFRFFGYAVDPVVIAVTVALSLLASALFMGVSERLTTAVERALFPEQARLAAALDASREELDDLRRRLQRAEKLAITGELAASVAHEIKNPLAPIKGYAQMLEKRLGEVKPEERPFFEKALKIIQAETDRIDGRIAELLTLARGDKVTSSRETEVDLHRVLKEAAAVAEAEPGVSRIVQRLDPRIGRVQGNEDELRGAFLNLLKNAAEAMVGTAGSAIEVVTHVEDRSAIVEVIDEGPGLSEAEADRVFAAFYTTKKGGTGLGLSIARSAVEAAGGAITIRGRTDRSGAVVAVELPMVEEKR
jgi:signal transduction histidine kinase